MSEEPMVWSETIEDVSYLYWIFSDILDGFEDQFYRHSWLIVGTDVSDLYMDLDDGSEVKLEVMVIHPSSQRVSTGTIQVTKEDLLEMAGWIRRSMLGMIDWQMGHQSSDVLGLRPGVIG